MKQQTKNDNNKLKLLLLKQQQYIKKLERQLKIEREKTASLEAIIDRVKNKGD